MQSVWEKTMNRRYLAVTLIMAVLMWACDSDDAEAEAPDEEPVSIEDLDDGLPPEGPFEGAHDPSEPVSAEEFKDTLVESFCLAYDHCRNEHLQGLLFASLGSSAMMLALHEGEEETARQIQSIGQQMESEGQWVASREQCEVVFGFTFSHGGYDADSLYRAMEADTVEYDPAAAGRCLAQFGQPFDMCTEVHQIVDEPDPEQATASLSAHQDSLAQHFTACSNTLRGTLEAGEACRFAYQCRDAICEIEPGEQAGVCSEPIASEQPGAGGAGMMMPGAEGMMPGGGGGMAPGGGGMAPGGGGMMPGGAD